MGGTASEFIEAASSVFKSAGNPPLILLADGKRTGSGAAANRRNPAEKGERRHTGEQQHKG